MSVAENIARVQERIAAACLRSGRKAEEITLLAVSKTFPPDQIRAAYGVGLRVFGENRVQEFAGKISALGDLSDAEWHMIGHLQTNKAAQAVELFSHIDSVDSVRLAHKLNSAASDLGKKIPVLIEINIGAESAKSGVAPDSAELENILNAAPDLPSLDFRGTDDGASIQRRSRAVAPLFLQNARTLPSHRRPPPAWGPDENIVHGHVPRL